MLNKCFQQFNLLQKSGPNNRKGPTKNELEGLVLAIVKAMLLQCNIYAVTV